MEQMGIVAEVYMAKKQIIRNQSEVISALNRRDNFTAKQLQEQIKTIQKHILDRYGIIIE